jgi:CHASE3 domain sensor protein
VILIAKLNKKNENRRKIAEKQKMFVSLQRITICYYGTIYRIACVSWRKNAE